MAKSNSTDIVQVLTRETPARITDPEETALAIVRQILEAPDAEAVLEMAGTTGARDMLGVPFRVRALRFMKSSFEEGSPVFAVVDIIRKDTGESTVMTCGGTNVTAQLARLQQLDALDRDLQIVQTEKPTTAGYYPLWLQSA